MEPKVLYYLGSSAVGGSTLFITASLAIATGVSVFFFLQRRHAGTLKPEMRFILLVVILILGGTTLLFGLSAIPDALRPPVIEKGRVLDIYRKRVDPDSDPVSAVKLSNGADLQIPDVLRDKLVPGMCGEMTRTPFTNYVLIAKELNPDDCLK